MNGTPYSRSCCKTIRRFFDDFDMLPFAIKELLWNGPSSPDLDDLKTAWELASADKSLEDLIKQIHCMKPTKEELKAKADAERERARREKRSSRSYYINRPIFGKPQLRNTDDKQARLVARVSEEEAMRLISKRQENKDVISAYVRPVIGYERVKVVEIDPNTIPPKKLEPPQSILKMMHNAGGKK